MGAPSGHPETAEVVTVGWLFFSTEHRPSLGLFLVPRLPWAVLALLLGLCGGEGGVLGTWGFKEVVQGNQVAGVLDRLMFWVRNFVSDWAIGLSGSMFSIFCV